MENELLDQGLTLMLAGMVTVFAFLTTLVIAMTLLSRVLAHFAGQPALDDPSDEEVAAISAAIARHRDN